MKEYKNLISLIVVHNFYIGYILLITDLKLRVYLIFQIINGKVLGYMIDAFAYVEVNIYMVIVIREPASQIVISMVMVIHGRATLSISEVVSQMSQTPSKIREPASQMVMSILIDKE